MKEFQPDFAWTYADEFRNRWVLKAFATKTVI